MPGLTYYNLVAALEQMQRNQQQVQHQLAQFKREYSHLAHDGHVQQMEADASDFLAHCAELIERYNQINAAAAQGDHP